MLTEVIEMANAHISKRLQDARKAAGLTQKDVYQWLGIGQSTFSAWETGLGEPSVEVFRRLCQKYEIRDIAAFFLPDPGTGLTREELDPVDDAAGIRELMTRCDLTQEQAARKLGKSRSALANSLRLLNLPETVLELLKSGFINTGHAKVVLGLPTPELQAEAAQIIADNQLNVRQAEALCKKMAKPAKEPREPAPRGTLPVEVEESLKQVLGSEVNVAYHGGKGKLTVHFYSDEQLRAFANLLGQYQMETE